MLFGIVGLDAHAHLHNAPDQDDNTQSLDDGENEVRQVIDDSEGGRTGSKGQGVQGRETAATNTRLMKRH